MTDRLCNATFAQLPSSIRRPSYDRNDLKPGVVHIGLGAFHRAHQAPVFEALAEAGDMRWGVIGASLRSPAVRDALVPQDFLYTLAVDEGERRDVTIVDVIRDVIVAPEAPGRLIGAIASPDTHIVTVTVTEKGYHLDPVSGALAVNDNDVAADLASLQAPRTMPGYLAAGLRARRERGFPPLTVISCDNIAGNGEKLLSCVIEIASAHDRSLGGWIERECAFPATMVDRIVPSTSQADAERMTKQLGVADRATVRTEAFWQWVIEDRFAGTRPELASVGVQVSSDVAAWEEAKLRLLNGAHSAMAYLGLLGDIGTVDRFVAEEWGRAIVRQLWGEVETTLEPSDIDIAAYKVSLMKRFANAALGHRLRQIAMDGSQKLPQRLIGPALELLDGGRTPSAIALVIAAWMRCQSGRSDAGERFDVDDPMAAITSRLVSNAANAEELAGAMLDLDSVFPRRLAGNSTFRTLVANHIQNLQRLGARGTIERFVGVCT